MGLTNKQMFQRRDAPLGRFERVEAGPTDVSRPNRLPESLSP